VVRNKTVHVFFNLFVDEPVNRWIIYLHLAHIYI